MVDTLVSRRVWRAQCLKTVRWYPLGYIHLGVDRRFLSSYHRHGNGLLVVDHVGNLLVCQRELGVRNLVALERAMSVC